MSSTQHHHEWYFLRETANNTYMIFGCRTCGKTELVKEL